MHGDCRIIERYREQPGRRLRPGKASACAALLLSIVIGVHGCGAAAPRPLSIKMHHAEKNTTLDCAARDLGLADRNMLADSVEACARILEKSGFVRQTGAL